MPEKADLDHRVLIFAPVGRDGPAAAEFVRRGGLDAFVCASFAALVEEAARGASVVLLAEEGLFGHDTSALGQWVAQQPT
jgi:hypothetical protein